MGPSRQTAWLDPVSTSWLSSPGWLHPQLLSLHFKMAADSSMSIYTPLSGLSPRTKSEPRRFDVPQKGKMLSQTMWTENGGAIIP